MNLYITGDSFSHIPAASTNNTSLWTIDLSIKLKCSLYNQSLPGASQDWSWDAIANWANSITPEDYLVIILTDPARFWFFEELPHASNSWIVDFDSLIGNTERAKAAEYYIRYIQRPSLDARALAHRLGWLNNLVSVKNWKKPLVILGHDQYIPSIDQYTNLILSTGTLRNASKFEECEDIGSDRGIDIRYNHLTLGNHKILADKIFDTFKNDVPLDLNSGFIPNRFSANMHLDPEIVKKELNPEMVEKFMASPVAKSPTWRDRFLK